MLLTVLVLAAFLAVPLVVLLARAGAASVIAAIPALLFAAFASCLPEIMAGGSIHETWSWIPSLGLSLAFRADGLSLLFALLITGIGTCVFLYAATYLEKSPEKRPAFFGYLTLFLGAMLGAVLADNLVLMLVFWELTSLSSFLLIGFDHEKAQARYSSQQGLLVTVGGGLALTAGVILLGEAAGSYRISEILSDGAAVAAHPWAPEIIVLVVLGAMTKSAQTPFHLWLPNAMVAPTPVSAYLHSATMVKLGVYLLARMNPAFEEQGLWTTLLLIAGTLTTLTGAVLALRETDLKRILAYSTLVALGALVSLLGLPHPLAAVAMATFLIVHAFYKACLFLVAGIIDHETGTRDSSRLRGLGRRMPVTAAAALLGAFAMAGLPPFLGFIGKELIYEVDIAAPLPAVAVGIAVFANAVTMAAAGIIAVRSFAGSCPPAFQKAHDPRWTMLFGPLALGVSGLVLGVMPGYVEGFIARVAEAVSGNGVEFHLTLWHGFTTALFLSLATFMLGGLLYVRWDRLRGWLETRRQLDRFGPAAAYDVGMAGFQHVAAWQTRLIQSGSLPTYLAATLITIVTAVAASLVYFEGAALPEFNGFHPLFIVPMLLVLAAIAVVRADTFISGLVAAGIVGFLMSLVFLFQGAPDLAFTQFSVEALSIVILLAIVGRMPFRETDYRTKGHRRRDAAIAVGFGMSATLVLLAVVSSPFNARLSDYYKATSLPEAHGRNIVNVIIVDFRALDTLGEITVLTLAAIAASALLYRRQASGRALATGNMSDSMEAE